MAYMLAGGVDASNTDPYATEPPTGDEWIYTGPHVMIIVPDPAALDGLPTDPNSGGPYVMWKGTPYAHIMMPGTRAAGQARQAQPARNARPPRGVMLPSQRRPERLSA
jgi:hypothetical protein